MSRSKRRPRYPRSAEKFGCIWMCAPKDCRCKRMYRSLFVRQERYAAKREIRQETN